MNGVRSLLNIPCLLLGYSFEPRPYKRVLGTAGSLMTIGLSIIGARTRKTREQGLANLKVRPSASTQA